MALSKHSDGDVLMIPRDCVGRWLKDHPHNNAAHRVLRYDGETLVAYCGLQFPAADASKITLGAMLCPKCVRLAKRQDLDRKRNSLLHRFNDRRDYVNH